MENRLQNGQATNKHLAPFGLNAGQADLINMGVTEHFADQFFQPGGIDAFGFPAIFQQRLLHRADATRGTHRLLPAQLLILLLNRLQFLAGGGDRLVKPGFGNNAVRKKLFGIGNTTHVQAFQCQWLEAFTNNKFGTAAANIHHQPFAGIVRLGMRHAQINQARFFTAGNHLNGIAQYLPGAVNKLLPVTRRAQGIGGQDADPAGVHALQKLRELAQTFQPALLGLFR